MTQPDFSIEHEYGLERDQILNYIRRDDVNTLPFHRPNLPVLLKHLMSYKSKLCDMLNGYSDINFQRDELLFIPNVRNIDTNLTDGDHIATYLQQMQKTNATMIVFMWVYQLGFNPYLYEQTGITSVPLAPTVMPAPKVKHNLDLLQDIGYMLRVNGNQLNQNKLNRLQQHLVTTNTR